MYMYIYILLYNVLLLLVSITVVWTDMCMHYYV